MNRKDYQKPTTEFIEADVETPILVASTYETGQGKTSINAMEDEEDLEVVNSSRAFSAFEEDL
jgi:hypothetical protein